MSEEQNNQEQKQKSGIHDLPGSGEDSALKREMDEQYSIHDQPEKIISQDKPEIQSAPPKPPADKQSIENMETHAQHLHKAPGQGWKHYLFEFFMLFLAVTAGYFVENMRENYVEGKREIQFISTLVEDLKSDTSQLNSTIEFKRTRELMVDSLALLLKSKERSKYGNDIYYFARSLTRARFFFPNDRTIQQLKSSGNLRLIHNLATSDNIMSYDQQVRYLLTNYESEREIVSNLREAEKEIFDGQVLLEMIEGAGLYELKRPTANPPLLTEDKSKLNSFIVQAQFVKSILNVTRQREEKLKQTAGELILFLKKEYRLE